MESMACHSESALASFSSEGRSLVVYTAMLHRLLFWHDCNSTLGATKKDASYAKVVAIEMGVAFSYCCLL